MAANGRPPKPVEQKRRTGNPGRRPLPAVTATIALEPATEVPPVPMELGENGRARWRQLWGGPAQAWLARDIDVVRVTTVCQLTDDISTYRRLLAAMGPVLEEPIVTPTGAITGEVRVVANPLVKMTRDAEKNLDRELSTLGFDPVSRSRLGLAEVKRRSILEQLNEPTSNGAVIDAEVVEIAADC